MTKASSENSSWYEDGANAICVLTEVARDRNLIVELDIETVPTLVCAAS